MKSTVTFVLGICALSSCQATPTGAPQNQQSNAVTSFSLAEINPLGLPLSSSLLNDLNQPDTESEPREQSTVSDVLIEKVLGTRYVHAHSYYFDHLDNGQSTIESILAHDKQTQAAEWVRHWRKTLSDGAVWPDRNSTTYQGRYTALEHGQVSATKGWLNFRNASTKAQEYYQLALKAWKPGVPADHPSQSEAWAWLGRTSHFLQDMSVPFHTKSFIRPAQALHHHPYELSSELYFDRYFPSRNHNPFGVWTQGGPYPATGNWGHYYPPGTSADTMIKQLAAQSQPFYKIVNRLQIGTDTYWEKSRAVLIPLGAKMTSGLIVAYLRDVGALKR